MAQIVKVTIIIALVLSCLKQIPSSEMMNTTIRFEVYLADYEPSKGLMEVEAGTGGRKYYLHRKPVITTEDIARAEVIRDSDLRVGKERIDLTLTENAGERIARITGSNPDKLFVFLVDGEFLTAAPIQQRLSGNMALIGVMTEERAKNIVARLNRK